MLSLIIEGIIYATLALGAIGGLGFIVSQVNPPSQSSSLIINTYTNATFSKEKPRMKPFHPRDILIVIIGYIASYFVQYVIEKIMKSYTQTIGWIILGTIFVVCAIISVIWSYIDFKNDEAEYMAAKRQWEQEQREAKARAQEAMARLWESQGLCTVCGGRILDQKIMPWDTKYKRCQSHR